MSLNESASRFQGQVDRTPTDYHSQSRDNSRDPVLPNREGSREVIYRENIGQFSTPYRESIRETSLSKDTTKDLFIPCRDNNRDQRELPCKDVLRSSNKDHYLIRSNRDGTKDSAVGRDVIYENDGGIRGYNLQTEVLVPDGGNRIHSVRKSNSSHKVTGGNSSSTVCEKRKFYCREWAFQKIAHCLEQRPVSKTCGALVLGI